MYLEVYQGPADCSLSPTQAHGTVTLLYKGRGSRSDPASYRPITLLNTDTKLLAKALADRWGTHLCSVVDGNQTAFLPGRWIGDNILAHLEEVEYLEAARKPGCIAFLDFSKAYDRLDRHWLMQCMGALGLGPLAQRWVQLLPHSAHSQGQWLALTRVPRRHGLGAGKPPVSLAVCHSSTVSGSSPAETGSPGVVQPHQQAGRPAWSTVPSACR